MKKYLWKDGEGRKDPLSSFPARQVVRKAVQERFGHEVQTPKFEKNKKWKCKLADISGYSCQNSVSKWRTVHGALLLRSSVDTLTMHSKMVLILKPFRSF